MTHSCTPETRAFLAAVADAERAQLVSDLKAARAELVMRGRCVNRMVDSSGRVCVLGAVGVVVDEQFEASYLDEGSLPHWAAMLVGGRGGRAVDFLNRLTFEHCGADYFNDDAGTTDADVLNLFDKALAELGGLA